MLNHAFTPSPIDAHAYSFAPVPCSLLIPMHAHPVHAYAPFLSHIHSQL